MDSFLILREAMHHGTLTELRECSDLLSRYGLRLSEAQMTTLAQQRVEALRDTLRMEFGPGILKKLLYAFCDSPYVSSHNLEDVMVELQDSFYYFKNESMDRLDDDTLIDYMKHHFDHVCHGSLEYLSGTTLEDLCRSARSGEAFPEENHLF